VFPNVEVIERDRPINGPTLTADDRTVMNGIDAILVVRKEVIHGVPMIRAVVVEIIPMMIIRGRRTTVHRAKMTTSGFPECRDLGSNCRVSMEVSLGRAGGHTSKTALRTIVGANATNWRS